MKSINTRDMIVNVELTIEVTGNVTEEEVAEFFNHEYRGCGCSLDNPLLWEGEAEYDIVDYNIEID